MFVVQKNHRQVTMDSASEVTSPDKRQALRSVGCKADILHWQRPFYQQKEPHPNGRVEALQSSMIIDWYDRDLVGGWTNPFGKSESKWVHLPQGSGWTFQKMCELPPPRDFFSFLHWGWNWQNKSTPFSAFLIVHLPTANFQSHDPLKKNTYHSVKQTAKAPENRPSQKETIVFQPSMFGCHVSFRMDIFFLVKKNNTLPTFNKSNVEAAKAHGSMAI